MKMNRSSALATLTASVLLATPTLAQAKRPSTGRIEDAVVSSSQGQAHLATYADCDYIGGNTWTCDVETAVGQASGSGHKPYGCTARYVRGHIRVGRFFRQ